MGAEGGHLGEGGGEAYSRQENWVQAPVGRRHRLCRTQQLGAWVGSVKEAGGVGKDEDPLQKLGSPDQQRSGTSLTWDLVRSPESQDPAQTHGIQICMLTSPPGGLHHL